MRVMHAGALQCRNDAIEFRNVGNRADADPIHLATRDDVIPNKNLAVTAAAQFVGQAFGVGGVGKGARLDEQSRPRGAGRRCAGTLRGGDRCGHGAAWSRVGLHGSRRGGGRCGRRRGCGGGRRGGGRGGRGGGGGGRGGGGRG